jgi:hypothetical protein
LKLVDKQGILIMNFYLIVVFYFASLVAPLAAWEYSIQAIDEKQLTLNDGLICTFSRLPPVTIANILKLYTRGQYTPETSGNILKSYTRGGNIYFHANGFLGGILEEIDKSAIQSYITEIDTEHGLLYFMGPDGIILSFEILCEDRDLTENWKVGDPLLLSSYFIHVYDYHKKSPPPACGRCPEIKYLINTAEDWPFCRYTYDCLHNLNRELPSAPYKELSFELLRGCIHDL